MTTATPFNHFAIPAVDAPDRERVAFLRKVGLLTFVGLVIAGISATVSAGLVIAIPALSTGWIPMIVMLGAIFASRAVGSSLVSSPSAGAQYTGFVIGTALQGVAMGYLVLSAVMLSYELYGNPLMMMAQAMGLVGVTVMGMSAYLLTGPKKLSMIKGGLAIMGLPMMVLMVISFVFPIGGPFGLILNIMFVAVSAGGMLYSLNQVMHQMSTSMHVRAAFQVTMGLLVLFWNVLTLLMRLQNR